MRHRHSARASCIFRQDIFSDVGASNLSGRRNLSIFKYRRQLETRPAAARKPLAAIVTKKILIFLLTSIGCLHGQIQSGRYSHNNLFLDFKADSVNFVMYTNGGLLYTLKGQGHYTLINEYLVITTSRYRGSRSNYSKDCHGEFSIRIGTSDSILRNQYSLYFKDKAGKYHDKDSSETMEIVVKVWFGDQLVIPYNKCHYSVELHEGNVLENHIITLKTHVLTDNQLTLELISYDIKTKPFNYKKIKRIDKNSRRQYGGGTVRQFSRT
jgi:hypothetical protein